MDVIGNVVYSTIETDDVVAVERGYESLVKLFVYTVAYFVAAMLKVVEARGCFLYILKIITKISQDERCLQRVVGGVFKPLEEVAVILPKEIEQRHGAGPLIS